MVLLPCLNLPATGSNLATEPGFISRNWDTEDGLPSGNISALAKTRDGFVWLGTAAGLVRYDGFQFNLFSSGDAPARTLTHISALFVDHLGELWIGPSGGAPARLADGKLEQLALDAALPRSTTWTFAEDQSGTMWGALEYAGVFSFSKGRTTAYGTNNGLPSTMVWDITVDRDGGIWVVSRWRLMRFDGQGWIPAEGVPDTFPKVAAITAASDGGLWIACVASPGPPTDRGARIFKYQQGRAIEDLPPGGTPLWPQDSRRSIPRVIVEDRKGRLWMTTRGAGIFYRDQKQWHRFNDSTVQGTSVLEDEDSMIWIATDGAGLYQVRPRIVATMEPPPGTPASCFWTVFPARDGSVWAGTDGNGILHWQHGSVSQFKSEQGLRNENVNAVLEDRHRRIWAGTLGGLFVLRNGRFTPAAGVAALQLPVYSLKEDHEGALWVGTRNGLVQISGGTTNVFGFNEGIPFGPINAIEEDGNGRIWVAIPPYRDSRASAYGLFAQAGRRFEHIAENEWAGGPNIRSLHADAAGNLWIGTIGTGLFRYHDRKFTEYSPAHGVPLGRIQALVSDHDGNLWCCSELGVFGCPLTQLENYTGDQNGRLSFWRVEHAAGLFSKTTTGNGQPCAAYGADGRIWFANGNVIASFDPQSVTTTARLQPPIIQDVLVNGVPQSPATRADLRITGAERRVEIHYTSPNTTAPDLPNFWIRLKGFDPGWMPGGGARAVSYNLRPGHYEFAVAVTGPAGARMETAQPLHIDVVPQFWERSTVRILAGAVFVGAIALGVWRWERARSQRRLRELEFQRAMDQVRQRIARDIHDDLGSGLTEITLLSDNLLANGSESQGLEKTVERIGARARALTHEMDEVVWAINPHTDTLESLATYLNDFAQERLTLAGIRCRLNTAAELPHLELSSDVRHSLFRAAKEALNNAIKYSGATEVAITIELHRYDLSFLIQDNGRGFDLLQRRRGNGLSIMRQRLEEIGGRCEIESTPGAGTSVRFTIPSAPHNHRFRSHELEHLITP